MSETLHVIGVDPGKFTGVAHWTRDKFYSTELAYEDVVPYVRGILEQVQRDGDRVFVGCQRFYVGPTTHKKSAQPHAMQLQGALETLCLQFDFPIFELQDSASAHKVGRDSELRRLNMWKQTRDGHANDAARHVLLTLLRFQPNELKHLLETGIVVVD